ncbi:threonyl-tRNA synthetase [Kappamyces sp. JEL0829]|nr:threonyl-tRNA synthetase [Kappamyces sp. JEL0829]
MSEVKPPKEKKEKKASGGAAPAPGAKQKKEATASPFPLLHDPEPEYMQHRIRMFDELKVEYDQYVAVTLPDGKVVDGTAWETTPLMVAVGLAKSLAERTVIAKVDGVLFDLTRPLEKSCNLQLLDFESDDGKKVFWHSSAHVLGEACEGHYGCHLCIGPPIEDGFYYEMSGDRAVSSIDYPSLETLAKKAVAEKQPFIRLEVPKAKLLEMFKHNKYKVHIINDKIPDNTSTTVYRCGPLIDLCYGPHIPHTGKIKAFKVTKNSASYFLGDAKNDSLQRVYGISFPEAKLMKEWEKFIEEAEKRDHRRIGVEQELFMPHELSPGSWFWFPHGTRIYNTLMELQRGEYRKRGFQEVITPNMYNTKLWETSGHWQNYAENMFSFDVEKEKFALKPMNCPGHCLMFGMRERSWRELPIRYADFGVLHRNEASGALSGLTRCRRFQQDDAHIFCRVEQLGTEMDGCLDFLQHIYGVFGFTFRLCLSTRPEKFLGEIATWDKAEALLRESLVKFGQPWELNEGDGAFYGPKIDIILTDALRRKHQCATIQLDFQLPERFKLEYRSDTQNLLERPVMIHRAILGSLERQVAILTEHYAGKWPFWLSPRQVVIIPVAVAYNDYAEKVRQTLHDKGIYVETDVSAETMKKKIRNAEIAHWNFIFVVGEEEQSSGSVNARNRDDPDSKARGQTIGLEDIVSKLLHLKATRAKEQTL